MTPRLVAGVVRFVDGLLHSLGERRQLPELDRAESAAAVPAAAGAVEAREGDGGEGGARVSFGRTLLVD